MCARLALMLPSQTELAPVLAPLVSQAHSKTRLAAQRADCAQLEPPRFSLEACPVSPVLKVFALRLMARPPVSLVSLAPLATKAHSLPRAFLVHREHSLPNPPQWRVSPASKISTHSVALPNVNHVLQVASLLLVPLSVWNVLRAPSMTRTNQIVNPVRQAPSPIDTAKPVPHVKFVPSIPRLPSLVPPPVRHARLERIPIPKWGSFDVKDAKTISTLCKSKPP
jgi:hypothetical protein